MISGHVVKPPPVGAISSDKNDNGYCINHAGYNYFVGDVQCL